MTNDLLEGRVLFWTARGGQIDVDVLAAPAGSPDALGTPIALRGTLPYSPLGVAILITLERWAGRGEPIRLARRAGRDGSELLRMAGDRTWLVIDLVGTDSTVAESTVGAWPEATSELGEGLTLR